MARDGGATTSLWTRADVPRFPQLGRDLRANVCIVGAGITGLTTALLLSREHREIVVLDDGPIGGGETARTTAHLASIIDDDFQAIERMHGKRGLELAYASQAAAIDTIEAIAAEHSIDCAFRRLDGYLFLGPDETESFRDDECAAAHRAGCTDAERLAHLDVGGRDLGPCVRFPRQAQFHPLRYLAGLARAAVSRGVRIFEGAHATSVEAKNGEVRVRLDGPRVVTADHVVVATNTPFNDRVVMHTKQAAYRTYAIAIDADASAIPAALYWDSDDPYHYVRLHEEGGKTLLIVGGEDHKTGQDEDPESRFVRLEAWVRERFPALGAAHERWSGQVLEPVDGVAFIGRNPADEPNVYIATGDSGMGLTHGTIAGRLITDLIAGRDNEWATLYDPSRKTLRAGGEWLKENVNVAAAMTDLVTPGDVSSLDEIPPQSGAVIRKGLSKIAAYRDESGQLHQRSAICPHLGCVVAWNQVEKSWDCPCHGSRFDTHGRVINGPSTSDLPPAD